MSICSNFIAHYLQQILLWKITQLQQQNVLLQVHPLHQKLQVLVQEIPIGGRIN
jgi:hypothetical protein